MTTELSPLSQFILVLLTPRKPVIYLWNEWRHFHIVQIWPKETSTHDFHKAHCSTYWSYISVKDPTGRIDGTMRKQAVRIHPVSYFQKLKYRESEHSWPTHRLTSIGRTRWQPAELSVSEAQDSLCMPSGSQLWVIPAWVITLIRNLLTSACTRAVNSLQFSLPVVLQIQITAGQTCVSIYLLTTPPYFLIKGRED